MTTLTSGGTTLLSGGFYLTSAASPGGGDEVPLAITVDTSANDSLTSTSDADIDATNFAVTFTAPASGNVLVVLSGAFVLGTTTAKYLYLGLRESTSTVAGMQAVAKTIAIADHRYISWRFQVTGLTPASSHTYKAAYKVDSGSTFTSIADTPEPRILEVWETP